MRISCLRRLIAQSLNLTKNEALRSHEISACVHFEFHSFYKEFGLNQLSIPASTMLGLLGFTCAPQATHGNRSRTNTTDERNRHRRVFEKPINQDLEEQRRHGTAVALAPTGFHRLRRPNASAMRRWNARIRVFFKRHFHKFKRHF